MRWAGQSVTVEDPAALPGLGRARDIVRTVRTPEFEGVTFHEVRARSALNHLPRAPWAADVHWTLNPYRGCTHACVYCFARQTHSYLELDTGADFDNQIVVKTNVVEVLRAELRRPSWNRETVAMGTNTDPYQRAEGRYRLMPGIIRALTEHGTPFTLLTKGTMLGRDVPLLGVASRSVSVQVSVSVALLDPQLQHSLEPGTPDPRARLDLISRVRDAGLSCGVLVAPVLPYLTDSPEALEALVDRLASAGATSISGVPLRLVPGAREWFLRWLSAERPDLVEPYRRLYRGGSQPPAEYVEEVRRRLSEAVRRAGLHHPGVGHGRVEGGPGSGGTADDGAVESAPWPMRTALDGPRPAPLGPPDSRSAINPSSPPSPAPPSRSLRATPRRGGTPAGAGEPAPTLF
jgi:DNA repair photolyase